MDTSLWYRLRILWAHKDLLRCHVPPLFRHYVAAFRKSQLAAARCLKGKLERGERLETAFFLSVPGMWKSDYLFQAMRNDGRFHPYVVVCPYSVYKGFGCDEVESTLRRTQQFITEKGFECVVPRDGQGRWIDVRRKLKPDMVVFTSPYKDALPQHYIYHYRHTLTCYVPYSVTVFKTYGSNYDLIFHNVVGLHFVETQVHKQLAAANARNQAVNVAVTGYPGTEVFFRKDYRPRDTWKPQPPAPCGERKKRVIWAPHHTIEDPSNLPLSTFLAYADDMLRLAEKHKEDLQFAFKPHQLLKFKLYELWGKERTDRYYRRWEEGENTQCEETSYVDLFLTSDAMVHDSGSFTAEYLYTRKPVMFLLRNEQTRSLFSPFGALAFEQHYQGRSAEDIEHFLTEVTLQGKDSMREGRERFFEQTLVPGGLLPSQAIIKTIENIIQDKNQ
ncbi:MAG: CDP-glycerol glycerophosphotransferase family protein [Bacteroidales bacterium]|nr:CDP-glycerol glycerophosphotransferase family protein [Bacteroidales bacterium]